MWGSDWPVCLLAATYEDVLSVAESFVAAMSAAERDEIFGGTALRWYSLEPRQSGSGQSAGGLPASNRPASDQPASDQPEGTQ